MQDQEWRWWEQKPRWKTALEELCEATRKAGWLMSGDEMAKKHRDWYFECVYHFGQTAKIIERISWEVFKCAPVKAPKPPEPSKLLAKSKLEGNQKNDSNVAKGKRYTDSEILAYLAKLVKEFGRMPTQDEINQKGGISYVTLLRRLGPKERWDGLVVEFNSGLSK